MMERDFEKEILAQEAELAQMATQMERHRQDFLSATEAFLEPWFLNEAKKVAEHEADTTQGLGPERIASLKAEIREHQKGTRGLVNQFIGDEALWWHLRPGAQHYHMSEYAVPDILDRAVRLVAGTLAPILERYGYLPRPANRGHSLVWREWDASGNHHPPNARPSYPGSIGWSQAMKAPVRAYAVLRGSAEGTRNALERLKVEKKQAEAGDLWNRS